MTVYLDTSSLLKLYLDERDSEEVKMLVTGSVVASSIVAYAEARAGLARARRLGRLTDSEVAELRGSFEARWMNVRLVDVTDSVVRLAGDCAEKYALRGFDAIHLASALILARELGEPLSFSAADDRLMDAAVSEGLIV